MLSLSVNASTSTLPAQAIVCHDVRDPAQRNEILVRKGSSIGAEIMAELLARGVGELHLAVAESGDVAEDAAAERLAAAVRGSGVTNPRAHYGQANLMSAVRGMFRVDRARLEQINTVEGVLLLTAEADRPIDTETVLGVMKCSPLLLGERALAAVEAVGEVLCVQPFDSKRVAFVAPSERLRGGAFERASTALSNAVTWYGSTLDPVLGSEATVESMSDAYAAAQRSGAELILAAGASGTDPLDVVFEGLRQAGGEVIQLGIPAEPGTACWIGELDGVPVLGLASCELFGQPGALDLLLPRLFSGARLDRTFLRELAYGGLLLGPGRIAPYH